jgi:hypothetical protein
MKKMAGAAGLEPVRNRSFSEGKTTQTSASKQASLTRVNELVQFAGLNSNPLFCSICFNAPLSRDANTCGQLLLAATGPDGLSCERLGE